MSIEIKVEDLEKARKRAARREWFEIKRRDVEDWLYNNKELVSIAIPGVIAATTGIAKVVSKNVNLRKSKDVKDLYCYDRSLGHYWSLRRELTNTEWVEIDRRKRNGEKLADILSEFRVLK